MAPKIFISHTRDSEEHHREVMQLAMALEYEGGYDVLYDNWNDASPPDWDRWLSRAVYAADFVLVICSSAYYEKVLHNTPVGIRESWSGDTLRPLLFNNKTLAHKWIPVLLSNGKPAHVLSPLKKVKPIRANDGAGLQFLLQFIRQAYVLLHSPEETRSAPGSPLTRMVEMLKQLLPATRSAPSFPPPSRRVDTNDQWERLRAPSANETSKGMPEELAPEEPQSSGAEPPLDRVLEPPTPEPQSPFQKGQILYAIPEQMTLGESNLCRVRIAPESMSKEALENQLTEEEKEIAKTEQLDISPVMKVELVEAGENAHLSITARNTAEQPVLPFRPTEWAFDVSPSIPGHCALLLRVSAKIQIPGFGERAFDVSTLNRAIFVTTTAADQDTPFSVQPVPDPSWDEEDEAAVRQSLSGGRADKAIERLANFLQNKEKDLYNKLILLQGRWNNNTNELHEGRVSAEHWDIVNSKVRHAVLRILETVLEAFPADADPQAVDWQEAKEIIDENLQ